MSDTLRLPFLLMCRSEDEDRSGAWVMTEVENKEDGDRVARALQAATGHIGPMPCELVLNTDEGVERWAKGSKRRKQAREQLRQQRRRRPNA